MPEHVPFFCADCDSEITAKTAVRKKDGRYICKECDEKLRRKAEDKKQRSMFEEQESLFNPADKLEGFTDHNGVFHPIRKSKGYNEFKAGDFEPTKAQVKKREHEKKQWEEKELRQVRRESQGGQHVRKNLASFVRKMGGIVPGGMYSGEIRRLGFKETGTTGLINRHARQGSHKQTAEYVMDAANAEGYTDAQGERFTSIGDFLLAVEHDATKHISKTRKRGDTAKQKRKKREAKWVAGMKNPQPLHAIRFYVAPAPTIRGWYVKKVLSTTDGKEKDGGIVSKHNTKREAKAEKDKRNDALKRAGLYRAINPSRGKAVASAKGALKGLGKVQGYLGAIREETRNTKREKELKARLKRARTPQARPKGKLPNPKRHYGSKFPETYGGLHHGAYRGYLIKEDFGGNHHVSKNGHHIGTFSNLPAAKKAIDELHDLGLATNPATDAHWEKWRRQWEKAAIQKIKEWRKEGLSDNAIIERFVNGYVLTRASAKRLVKKNPALFSKETEKSAPNPMYFATDAQARKLKRFDSQITQLLKGSDELIRSIKARGGDPDSANNRGAIDAFHRKVLRLIKERDNYLAKLKEKRNPALFSKEAEKQARQVQRIRPIAHKVTREPGEIVATFPDGWVKVKWSDGHSSIIRRSELKLRRGLKSNPSEYDHAVDAIEKELRRIRQELKADGTTAISKPNIKQLVRTSGLTVPVGAYHRAFDEAFSRVFRSFSQKYGKPLMYRTNPSLRDVSKMFRGKVNGQVSESYAANGAPSGLALAGKLVFLKLAKGQTLKPSGATVGISSSGKLWIVANSKGGMFEPKAKGRQEALDYGEIKEICYETSKAHIGNGKRYEYVHKFGEDGGRKPHLLVDHEGMPILRGGDYKIKAEGIVN